MKKSLVLVSLLFLASLSIARAESPNVSTDQVNKQDSFLLVQNDRDTNMTDLLIGGTRGILFNHCGRDCEKDSHCDSPNITGCSNCIHGKCRN